MKRLDKELCAFEGCNNQAVDKIETEGCVSFRGTHEFSVCATHRRPGLFTSRGIEYPTYCNRCGYRVKLINRPGPPIVKPTTDEVEGAFNDAIKKRIEPTPPHRRVRGPNHKPKMEVDS